MRQRRQQRLDAGLGWQFPVHIYDLHTACLAASNILLPYNPDEVRKKPRKRLSDACRAYGIEGWERIDKETISKAIGDGTWCELFTPLEVVDYCEEDVRMSVKLLRRQLLDKRGADVDHVLAWSNYSAKAIARIQARGMPIDLELWHLVQENKAAGNARVAGGLEHVQSGFGWLRHLQRYAVAEGVNNGRGRSAVVANAVSGTTGVDVGDGAADITGAHTVSGVAVADRISGLVDAISGVISGVGIAVVDVAGVADVDVAATVCCLVMFGSFEIWHGVNPFSCRCVERHLSRRRPVPVLVKWKELSADTPPYRSQQ
jgi:hypothetical protein